MNNLTNQYPKILIYVNKRQTVPSFDDDLINELRWLVGYVGLTKLRGYI